MAKFCTAAAPPGVAKDDPTSGPGTRRQFARSAEIGFTATVRAQRLRFSVRPEVRVGFPGDERNESISASARRNLTHPVAAGTDYPHPRISYVLASCIDPDTVLDDVRYSVEDEEPRPSDPA